MDKKNIPQKGAREAALRALVRVEEDGAYLNLVLPSLLQNASPAERALAVQIATGTIQRLNTIDWVISLYSRRNLDTYTPWLRNLLRLSVYQIMYLDRVPHYALVDEAVRLARRFGHRGVAGLANALLRRIAAESTSLPWPDSAVNSSEYLSLKQSQPLWLIDRLISRLGLAEAESWCLASNQKPLISIRPNLLRIDSAALIVKLQSEGLEASASPVVPAMLRLAEGASPAAAKSFREGLFTIQGESSALVAPLLAPRPGDLVIDLCSAPGGKTTHLAELIGDSGRIYACDLHQSRLHLVEKAASRLGLQNITTVAVDGRNPCAQNLPPADAILVDAPCSGLGVIRRLPEIKWRRNEEDLLRMQALQIELLTSAARLLKPGGKLLYSVCTTEPEETEAVVAAFNMAHQQFIAEELLSRLPLSLQSDQDSSETIKLWPQRHDLDGFFIALWRKMA
ncbi:MAG: 16S rRNA (cytosine(967)-C(5))-methyltransferase RsmB [Dethiobacteria bacterium]|nr:16S rRNA (cytosine(967)-C(5))-methyltransferase RsmB [Dethiobacteria bacterium]